MLQNSETPCAESQKLPVLGNSWDAKKFLGVGGFEVLTLLLGYGVRESSTRIVGYGISPLDLCHSWLQAPHLSEDAD